ncbi:hypothetical protein COOONC_22966 [Cooperia oncophora]
MPEFNPNIIGLRAVFPSSTARLHYCRWHIPKTWGRKVEERGGVRCQFWTVPFGACFPENFPHHRERINNDLKQILLIGPLNTFQLKFGQLLAYAYLDVEKRHRILAIRLPRHVPSFSLNSGRATSWTSFGIHNGSHNGHNYAKNANSRVDCFVELLRRAVEDLADSNENRRRLATASCWTQQTSKRHRLAPQLYKKNPQKISETGSNTWEIRGKKSRVEGKMGMYLLTNIECALSFVRSVPLYREYRLCCSDNCIAYVAMQFLDNRAHIPCIHRHAVKILKGPAVSEGDPPSHLVNQGSKDIPPSGDVASELQSQLETRKTIRNEIELAFSVVSTNVSRLVNTDTDETLSSLCDIRDLITAAPKMVLVSSSVRPEIAARPELTGPGRKPLLQRTALDRMRWYRSCIRVSVTVGNGSTHFRDQSKDNSAT